MHKSFFLSFLIIVAFSLGVSAQAPPLPPQPVQWEYLVVGFGGSPGSTIITAEKDAAQAKVGFRQVYYGDKVVRYGDNANYQAALDDLGKAGWELVSVLPPAEDRPVSYIFKRQFNQGRAQKRSYRAGKAGTGSQGRCNSRR